VLGHRNGNWRGCTVWLTGTFTHLRLPASIIVTYGADAVARLILQAPYSTV